MMLLRVTFFLLLSINAASEPRAIIHETLSNLIQGMQTLPIESDQDYQNLINTHVSPNLDILGMGQLILGDFWKRSSVKQKQRFLDCFKRQFSFTQAQALAQWQPDNWQIQQQSFNNNGTKAAVIIELRHDNESRTFTLRLHLVDEKWLIYDAAYLGLSLLKTFKDDYALKISQFGLSKTLAQVCQTYPKTIRNLTIAGTLWPPYIGRSLPGQGLSVEIVKAVLTQAGYDVNMVFAPWKKIRDEMQQGSIDISVAAWKSPQRQEYLSFSDPYFDNRIVAITPKDSKIDVATLTQALSSEASLGLIDDYAYSPVIQQYPNRRYFKEYRALFRALATKDLDFSLLDTYVAHYYLERFSALKPSLQVSTISLESKPLHISMIKQHPAAKQVINDFNRYLKIYLKSADFQALQHKYQLQ